MAIDKRDDIELTELYLQATRLKRDIYDVGNAIRAEIEKARIKAVSDRRAMMRECSPRSLK